MANVFDELRGEIAEQRRLIYDARNLGIAERRSRGDSARQRERLLRTIGDAERLSDRSDRAVKPGPRNKSSGPVTPQN